MGISRFGEAWIRRWEFHASEGLGFVDGNFTLLPDSGELGKKEGLSALAFHLLHV